MGSMISSWEKELMVFIFLSVVPRDAIRACLFAQRSETTTSRLVTNYEQ